MRTALWLRSHLQLLLCKSHGIDSAVSHLGSQASVAVQHLVAAVSMSQGPDAVAAKCKGIHADAFGCRPPAGAGWLRLGAPQQPATRRGRQALRAADAPGSCQHGAGREGGQRRRPGLGPLRLRGCGGCPEAPGPHVPAGVPQLHDGPGGDLPNSHGLAQSPTAAAQASALFELVCGP